MRVRVRVRVCVCVCVCVCDGTVVSRTMQLMRKLTCVYSDISARRLPENPGCRQF